MIKVDCENFIKETFLDILGVHNPSQEALDYYWSAIYNDNLLFEDVISDITSSNQFFSQAQGYYPFNNQAENFI